MSRGCVYTRRHDYYSFGYMIRQIRSCFYTFDFKACDSLRNLENELIDLKNEKIDPDVLIHKIQIHMLQISD